MDGTRTVKDGRSGPAPFTGIPVDGPEFVVAMTKSDGLGGPVWTHRVKRNNHLAAALRPTAMLGRVVFADVLGGEHRGAIRSQVKGKDPSCRIGRRRMTLVDTGGISLPAPANIVAQAAGMSQQSASR